MRISIVSGFFLPIPPVGGGATEKSWYNLARQFAARGNEVTLISRRWNGFPNRETSEGIHHVRLPGADHQRRLWRNLFLDWWWSWRVFFALPAADIVVVNAVALPIWLGWLKPRAGRVVIMAGRMPKGQYRHYHRIARILAPSSLVRDKVVAENPALSTVTRVCGYPIDWRQISGVINSHSSTISSRQAAQSAELTIGFVGRINEEKGLLLFADALKLLNQACDLPPWRVLLCGPSDIARGGSGPAFRHQLIQKLSQAMPTEHFTLLDPQFNEQTLAGIYRRMTIFCYPSLAAQGETFGVAVAEAMAAGAVPVVSQLACFTDFVHDGKNGLTFDHSAPNAPVQLAAALERLLRDAGLRQLLAHTAQQDVRAYDYASYADSLLDDFATLTASANHACSHS